MRSLSCSFVASACAAVVALTACSGGGVTPTPSQSGTSSGAGSAQQPITSFAIRFPGVTTASKSRNDLAASTQSVTIIAETESSALALSVTANIGPSISGCALQSGSLVCIVREPTPVGNDRFAVSFYSGEYASGTTLAQATVAATIGTNQSNTVSLTLGGTVQRIALVAADSVIPYGAGVPVALMAQDAQGETIVGPYNTTIDLNTAKGSVIADRSDVTAVNSSDEAANLQFTLVDTDTSGELSASTGGIVSNALSFSGGSGIREYDIAIANSADASLGVLAIHPATNGSDTMYYEVGDEPAACVGGTFCAPSEIGAFNPVSGQSLADVTFPATQFPSDFLPVPDGSIWIGEEGTTNELVHMTSLTGSATTISIPEPPWTASPQSIPQPSIPDIQYLASDGVNLWFTDVPSVGGSVEDPSFTGGRAGYLPLTATSSSSIHEFDLSPGNPKVLVTQGEGIAADAAGNAWVADYAGGNIDRVTRNGAVAAFETPQNLALSAGQTQPGAQPVQLTAASDGNIYFTQESAPAPPVSGWFETFEPTTSGSVAFAQSAVQPSGDAFAVGSTSNGYVAFGDGYEVDIENTTSGKWVQLYDPAFEGQAISGGAVGDATLYESGWCGSAQTVPCIQRIAISPTWSLVPNASIAIHGLGRASTQPIAVLESGNSGPFTATTSNALVATVAQASAALDHDFYVTGASIGTCVVTITDAHGRSGFITVTVSQSASTSRIQPAWRRRLRT